MKRLTLSSWVSAGTAFVLAGLSIGAAQHAKSPATLVAEDDLASSEQQHVVEPGDTLWGICEINTGKPWLWPKVWALNPEITNPHWIYPGDIIRFVPPTELPPTQAELVASKAEAPDTKSIKNVTEGEAEKARLGPRVEVIQIAPPPNRLERDRLQHVFNGTFVTPKEVSEAGRLTNAMPDRVMLQPKDSVFITTSKNRPAHVGDRFITYRVLRALDHPTSGKRVGYMTEVTGALTIKEVGKDVNVAQIDSVLREVERGQLLLPLTSELLLTVQPIPAKKTVDGMIIAVQGDGVSVGEQKFVFIDRGKADGLERGTQLKVRDTTDEVTKTGKLPNVDLATLVVVDPKDGASTCLVVESVREVGVGDVVRAEGNAPVTAPRSGPAPRPGAGRAPAPAKR